jgi:hypothetical protein
VADETLYLTHQEIQDIRAKADHRDEPGVLFRGQRIVGYREWMEGDVYSGVLRRGVCAGGWRVAGARGKARLGGDHARQAKGGRFEDERQKP